MRKPDSLSHPSHLEKVALYEQWAPGPLQAFRNLAEQCFANGRRRLRGTCRAGGSNSRAHLNLGGERGGTFAETLNQRI